MKFSVSTNTLLRSLRTLCYIYQCSIPILKYFLFEVKEGKMTVTTANMETVLSTELEIESSDCGFFAVSPRVLLDTLKCMPEQPLIFKINQSTFRVEIIAKNGGVRLKGINAKKLKKEISKRHPNALKLNS